VIAVRDFGGVKLGVREMERADRAFVGMRWGSSLFEPLGKLAGIYHPGMRKAVDDVLEQSRVLVVCSADAPTTLHGFAATDAERTSLHYAYVLPKLRGAGIAKFALEAAFGAYPLRVQCAVAWPFPSRRFTPARMPEKARRAS
jgi:hypothetical protein